MLSSFLIHRDSPKTMGWRADNFWAALRRDTLVLAPMALVLTGVGIAFGMGVPSTPGALAPLHFWRYFAFCLLQQVGLNSLLSNRIFLLIERPWLTALFAGTIFALLHWPNPVLMPATFIAGVAMSWLFVRERNILPLALWQMVLGMLLGWAFPIAWHHALHVGPGYYTFHH